MLGIGIGELVFILVIFGVLFAGVAGVVLVAVLATRKKDPDR